MVGVTVLTSPGSLAFVADGNASWAPLCSHNDDCSTIDFKAKWVPMVCATEY